MKAKKRPPRKLFFSAKGRLKADITFLEEPDWVMDAKERECLRGLVMDHEEGAQMILEQYPPDAYDLSEALVQGLGSQVTSKRALVEAKLGQRTSNGKTVSFISEFAVTPRESA